MPLWLYLAGDALSLAPRPHGLVGPVAQVEEVAPLHVDRHLHAIGVELERPRLVRRDAVARTHALPAVERQVVLLGEVDGDGPRHVVQKPLAAADHERLEWCVAADLLECQELVREHEGAVHALHDRGDRLPDGRVNHRDEPVLEVAVHPGATLALGLDVVERAESELDAVDADIGGELAHAPQVVDDPDLEARVVLLEVGAAFVLRQRGQHVLHGGDVLERRRHGRYAVHDVDALGVHGVPDDAEAGDGEDPEDPTERVGGEH